MPLILKVLIVAVVISLVAGISAASAPAAAQRNCDEKLEKQAHEQPEPRDWNGLYRLFRQFGACDSGAIGERFSADVAQLFSKQWAHLDTLSHFAAADKSFERFVLHHIDTTLDEDDLLHIADNSKLHCPTGENRICGLIHAKARESLDKLRDVSE